MLPPRWPAMLALLGTRRFGPLFVTQLLGAFNDNLFKTAFIFMVTYQLRGDDPAGAALLATLASGLFILPFLLLSGPAGALCDARDKAAVARWVKIAEIAFMLMGLAALWRGSEALALAVVALMGVHSTVFGPVKYAILPQHLAGDELPAGTGLVEGATFVAILAGQIAGGLLPPLVAGTVAVVTALIGWVVSRAIPPAPPAEGLVMDWRPVGSARQALAAVWADARLRDATFCISWFWALGAVFTSQFVPLARSHLGGSEDVATLFLAAFSIGIALGSVLAGRIARGPRAARLALPAGMVMAAAALDLPFAIAAAGTRNENLNIFLAEPAGWRLLGDLVVMAVAGGVFSVPLYGVLQTAAPPGSRARAIAANNIVNAGFQVGGVLAIGAAVGRGVAIPSVLAVAGLTVLALVPALRRLG